MKCFKKSFASHPKAKYWSPTNSKLARQVHRFSGKKAFFDCECGHSFQTQVASISDKNVWCSYCSNKKLCDDETCNQCFKKSFASHPKAKYWADTNEHSPRQYLKSSHTKHKFVCYNEECGHTFETALHKIVNGNTWCPYCCAYSQKLCPEAFNNNCDICFTKSFAALPQAAHWSPKNTVQPWECMKGSSKKYLFVCPNQECQHEFSTSLAHITSDDRWCPYCPNPSKRLCPDTSLSGCQICRSKTFVNHPRAKFWSPKNKKSPEQVFRRSQTKYIFNCQKCKNEFTMSPDSVAGKFSWCPVCKHKTEAKLYEWLQSQFKNVKKHVKFDWCKNHTTDRHLIYDFVIGDIIIELDGPQHFIKVSNWQAPEITQWYDRYKEQFAIYNGKSVIRLLQDEVLADTIDWQTLLSETIARLSDIPETTITELYRGKQVDLEYKFVLNFQDQN